MSLPNDITAVDDTTITDGFWNDLVENYEAIFDGSAFEDGTVKTKYGTVARYVRLHAGLTSQPISLIPGSQYLAIMFSSDHWVKSPRITQGGSVVLSSHSTQSAYLFTPGSASLMCAASGDSAWGDVEVEFLIIKLDNQADQWANSASIPNQGLSFADEEVLQATKVNKVIANVNAKQIMMNAFGVEKLDLENNTPTSMVPIAFANGDEVTTPASVPAYKIVSELPFEVPTNLAGSAIFISVSAEYLDQFYPVRVDVRDSEENIVETKDFEIWVNMINTDVARPVHIITTGLSAGLYTVELVYYLSFTGTHQVNTSYPGVTNITVMAFGA